MTIVLWWAYPVLSSERRGEKRREEKRREETRKNNILDGNNTV